MKKQKILALLLSAAMLVTQAVPAYAQSPDDAAPADEVSAPAALPYGLKGMPDGYKAGNSELKSKTRASSAELGKLTPGVDYAARQIIYLADSREEAEVIAEAYNAELVKFQFGVATAKLTGDITVAQAVEVGADADLNMPLVSPNYITEMEEPVQADESAYDAPESDELASTWEEWWLQLSDPALTPGYYAEVRSAEHPDDPGTETKGYQWMHDAIGTYEAWATTMGSSDITVAVIDSGVDDMHEDLKDHATNLPGIIDLSYTQIKVDDNGNYVVDENGDYVYETIYPEALDGTGHGTHVAGIIAASADNGLGGIGVAPGVNIIGLPIFIDYNGENVCLNDAIVSAILYAAGYNEDGSKGSVRANIINMSIGTPIYDAIVQEAIDKAYAAKVTICAAMGNECTNVVSYPAAYDHVIAVSATDRNNTRAYFSNYGAWADIAAPGVGIFSTWNGHGYDRDKEIYCTDDHHDWYDAWNGTSMATPVVCGACALYMSAVGVVDPDTMEAVIKASATKLSDKTIGAGLLNVAAMMPDTVKNASPEIYIEDYDTDIDTQITTSGKLVNKYDCIIFRAPKGVAAKYVIYTLNGQEPTVKNGKLGKNTYICETDEYVFPQFSVTAKNITLKAALVGFKGTVGKTAAVTLDLPEISRVFYISGPAYAAVGKSVTYTTYRNGTIPKGAKINWSLENAPAGVSISKTGKVTVKKDAPVGAEFDVVAVASDDPTLKATYTVVTSSPIASMSVRFEEGTFDETVNAPVKDKNGNYKSIRLFTVDIPTTEFDENAVTPEVFTNVGGECKVSVANPQIVEYNGDELYGVSPGKTKVTFAMTDGSGLKQTIEVNVVVPASDINLKAKNGQKVIAYGKSAQVETMLGYTYGTPSVTAVEWDYTVDAYYWSDNNELTVEDFTDLYKNNKLLTISKTGKVTLNSKAYQVENSVSEIIRDGTTYYLYDVMIYVIAATTDGTGLSSNIEFKVSLPTSKLNWNCSGDENMLSVKGSKITVAPMATTKDGRFEEDYAFCVVIESVDSWYGNEERSYIFYSDKPETTSIEYAFADNECACFYVILHKPGKAKLTFIANDGTNKKLTINVESKGVK
ncbi:MAG: S8 family serine peptidase [Ruminiclostridium sp.]|nr:S8 family serine peptidase [Ruminiclostridium sp.]